MKCAADVQTPHSCCSLPPTFHIRQRSAYGNRWLYRYTDGSTQKGNLALTHSQVVSQNQYSQLWLWQKNWAEQFGTLWQTWLRNTELKLTKSKRPEAAETGFTIICYFFLSCICAPAGASPQLCTSWMKTEWQKWTKGRCDPGVKHSFSISRSGNNGGGCVQIKNRDPGCHSMGLMLHLSFYFKM